MKRLYSTPTYVILVVGGASMWMFLVACMSVPCGGHVAAELTWEESEVAYSAECAGPFEFTEEQSIVGQGQCIHEDIVIDILYEGTETAGEFTVQYDFIEQQVYVTDGWRDGDTLSFVFTTDDLPYEASLFAIIVDELE